MKFALLASYLCLLGSHISLVTAIGQSASITFEQSPDAFYLASSNRPVNIFLDKTEWPGVVQAAKTLAIDFGRVTGTNGTIHLVDLIGFNESQSSVSTQNVSTSNVNSGKIIVRSLDRSPIGLTSGVCGATTDKQLKGEWESFCSTANAESKTLSITGSDKRGTIYGLYDISEQIGVSPWYWFSDVPVQKHDQILAMKVAKREGPPTVKYRGIFINDEAPALTGWANTKFKKSETGSPFVADFYVHVFELLLRLRANYLWPAMWGSMFNVDDSQNQRLADEYGIVMGTSHTEPMMRATKEQSTFVPGVWQWSINNSSMRQFMYDGAARAKGYESIFTMGARGNHDTAINGGDAINQLTSIIQSQKQILDEVYTDNTKVPQVITLYTEVLSYYDDEGLKIPEDITLLFADDNFGNIRRLPYGKETMRSGGAGVYYDDAPIQSSIWSLQWDYFIRADSKQHFDFVGPPRSYKWIDTINLQRTWEQMSLAYARNARRVWIVNVGDIKALEIPTNHFLDLAWNMNQFKEATSTSWWLDEWAKREFGPDHAQAISGIVATYSKLAGRRKFEAVGLETYSILHYDEANKVLEEWQMLKRRAEDIRQVLSKDAQAAYFELVLHPISAAANMHEVVIYAAWNQLYASQGRNTANRMAHLVEEKWQHDHELTIQYHQLLHGKWDHMMDTPHFYKNYWQQPMRQQSPPVSFIEPLERGLSGEMGISIEGSHAVVPGDDAFHANSGEYLTLPAITPFSSKPWFEVFAQSPRNFSFAIQSESFVRLSRRGGNISSTGTNSDVRVFVDIEWANVRTEAGVTRMNISSSTDYGTQYEAPYLLLPFRYDKVPDSFKIGFVEGNNIVSMEACHFTKNSSGTIPIFYLEIPDIGRNGSGMTLSDRNAEALDVSSGPWLEYDFYTFQDKSTMKPVVLSVFLTPSLNVNPTRPLRYAFAIDDTTPRVVQYVVDKPKEANQGGWPKGMPYGWEEAVLDVSWQSRTNLTIGPGRHTLRFWALEAGVVVTKFVIHTGEERKSYLGPPESYRMSAK